MTDSAYPDLAKVEDWLNAKGYTGEAGACHAAMDKIREQAARIAELEDGLSSACEYAEKYEAALKRLYDAALDIDVNEMSFTERDWWQTELRAARAAYLGETK